MRKITCSVRELTVEEKQQILDGTYDVPKLNSEALKELIDTIESFSAEERAFWHKERKKVLNAVAIKPLKSIKHNFKYEQK